MNSNVFEHVRLHYIKRMSPNILLFICLDKQKSKWCNIYSILKCIIQHIKRKIKWYIDFEYIFRYKSRWIPEKNQTYSKFYFQFKFFLSDGKNYSISDHPIQPINCLKGLKASFFVSLRSVKLLIEFFFQSSLLTKNVVIHLKCWSIILKRESWKNNRNSISIKEILAKNNPITTFLPVPFDAMSSYTIWSIKHSIQ